MRPPHVFINHNTWPLWRYDQERHPLPLHSDKAVLWRNRARLRRLSRGGMARLEWMILFERGHSAAQISRRCGIAPKTFWKWRKRFREDDFSTLEERSRVPDHCRTRTITQQEEVRIVDLR